MADDSAVFARPTSSAMVGKQTVTIKTMVSDEVSEDFARFMKERGYASQSDCLRELLLTAIYGPEHIADLHRQRIASLFGHRPAIGTPT
jgi:hypothetical protein